MHSPSNAEGPAIDFTMSGPLDFERFGRQLFSKDAVDGGERQAVFIARRFGLPAHRARLVAGLCFPGGAR